MRLFLRILLALFLASPCMAQSASQVIPFGSADKLSEQLRPQWWRQEHSLYTMAGLSLIGAQWRAASNVVFDMVTRPITARLSGSVRVGPLGRYLPDWDEPYDVLRILAFARYNAPRAHAVHLRAGPIDQMRLGTGHIVNFFSSSVAWDQRTVGAEAYWATDILELAGFTDNVLFDGVRGGRIALRPLAWIRVSPLASAQIGMNYVTDRPFEAYNADLQFDLFSSSDIFFAPFVSYAWYTGFGDGISFGADIYSDHFIDIFRFRIRLAILYNSKQFIPGYVNTFYMVNNLDARIVRSATDMENLAGIRLDDNRGGDDLLTELRLSIFPDFSFWYYHRHHFGTQPLSELHIRLFWRSGTAFQLEAGIDRMGKGGLINFFDSLEDQTALVLATDYHLIGPLYIYVRARYSFEEIHTDPPRFLVQRRFEPFAGVRFRF